MSTIATKVRSIARWALRREVNPFVRTCYGQEGEDVILQRLFDSDTEPKIDGFYVDIGAHHPHRFSNTYVFYEMGWRGINVDAMPGSMRPFRQFRPRDTNVEAAISDREETLTYIMFNEPALNGFSEVMADRWEAYKAYRVVGRVQIVTRTLKSVLDEFLPADQRIDFMTVDVEGLDLSVLKSNDWRRYRPRYLLAEDTTTKNLAGALESSVTQYMKEQDYELCAKAVHTMFFRDKTR